MPAVGGIDVLQIWRSDELNQAIPVVILTGSADERYRVDAGQLGAAGYLMKPIGLDEMKKCWPD
jgi:two-component system, response regulator